MIDHERARELASMSRESSLDPADREWLDAHLAACESCRAAIVGSEAASLPGNAGSTPTRPRLPDRRAIGDIVRRPAFLLTISAVALTLVAGGLAWNVSRQDDDEATASGHPAGTTPGASANPVPSTDVDPWASLAPSTSFDPEPGVPAVQTAVLTALGGTAGVVPLDAAFRLASADATPASVLATRLTVQPDVELMVTPEAGDRAVRITPAAPLRPGLVYRFALNGTAGELLDSWAFQARQVLRVVGTLPSDQSTDVPVDTGIEITFDQDGVTDAAAHVSIKPATAGRFEEHGRTVAFVPDHPLAPATVYTVTVSRGVTVAGSGEATETETRFRFETAGTTEPVAARTMIFQDELFESPTAERPIVSLYSYSDDEARAPKTVRIEVYRLADLAAGVDAFQALRGRPDWSRWSTEGLVDTKGLRRLVAANVPFNKFRDIFWIQLPERLPAGWYVVQHPDAARPIQTVLQVTDVAGYLAISETTTLVWANDLVHGGPIAGATVASAGAAIGRTDGDGLVSGPTPKGLLPQTSDPCLSGCEPVVTVRTPGGQAIFLPATSSARSLSAFGDYYYGSDADPGYWSVLHTDRNRYRPTDTINVWGVVRDRDTGKLPATVTLRLTARADDDPNARPPVLSLTAKPGPAGSFVASMPLVGLAEGSYDIGLLVGGQVVRTTYVDVGAIAKPAYRLAVDTGRRVYIAGDRIKVTVHANFFEGTPVAGVPLRIDGYVERNVTTGPDGMAIYRTTAKVEPNQEGPSETVVGANPARAEEGEIVGASHEFVVFPSTRTVDADARIATGKVRVSGSVHLVDVARLESKITGGQALWELDPRGAAVRSATVTVRFVELIPRRRQIGTEYDFIEKKAVPVYETDVVEREAGSVRAKTTANGSFTASIAAAGNDHDYQVVVTVGDPDGHVARTTSYANRHPWTVYQDDDASLLQTTRSADDSGTFRIGDRVDVTMNDPETKQSARDGTRYLFFVTQRGLRATAVQSSPRFVTTFREWAAPNMMIGGVRFTRHGYTGTVRFDAQFRASDRRLQVDLSTRADRYAPGGMATVDIRTRDASGAPVAATVILRAVDDKLFSIGAASQDDPLADIYAGVTSGVVATYESHRNPRTLSGGEGGDTTGGGGDDRVDFRDSVLFKSIVTAANGRGSVSFRVSDDLTSWRVNASAITAALDAGSGSVLVSVGLPFFVDASLAPEYLLADRPSIVVRAFGSAMSSDDGVTIQVVSRSLGYDSGPIRAVAFDTTVVRLPSLRLGTQTLTISATTGSGAARLTDRLTRSFTVVTTHLTRARSAFVELPVAGRLSGGEGMTSVVVSDASAGRFLPLLDDLASSGGARLDRGLAADLASALLVSRFASTPGGPAGGAFVASRYQTANGGLALLPYSSSDLELSALVALVAPDRVDRTRLASYLRSVRADVAETRERQTFALAGLAGLGEPVLPAIQAAAVDRSLAIRERLMIGLGAAALGDADTARSIAGALIADHGERLGAQARLRVGSSAADITEATALMADLTAAVGDDRAPSFWAYVEENPAVDRLEVLPAIAYVTNSLARLPVQATSFAYSVDGTRRVVSLERASSFELSLTAAQLASLTIERISGSLGVATSWREPIRATAFKPDPDVTITRSMKPSSTISSGDLVRVDLTVTFGPQAASGCHQVTELVPSGLTPVGSLATWVDPDDPEAGPVNGAVSPYDQSGPRVFFCAEPNVRRPTVLLRYYARVVTPGTYAWEPTVAESRSQEGRAAVTSAGTIVVR